MHEFRCLHDERKRCRSRSEGAFAWLGGIEMKNAMKMGRPTFLAPLLMLSPAPTLAAPECPEVDAAESTLQTWSATMRGDNLQASPGGRVQASRRQQDVQAPRDQQDVQAPRGQQDVQAPRDQDVQAPRGQQDVQAPRGQQDVQAPRDQQDVQAPRGQQDVQAPRDQQDVQAPRGQQDVQAPRDGGPTAARLTAARALIDEARTACERGDRAGAREKAGSALELVRTP
jgi:hypothetical protein